MLRSVELRDYMLPNPHTVAADSDLFDAMNVILENKISGVCVVDEDNSLIGMLSEMDCLNAILKATYADVGVGKVSEFMSKEVDTAKPYEDIVGVAFDMLKKSQRRRPVVDDDNRLVGQITCRGLLKAVGSFSR